MNTFPMRFDRLSRIMFAVLLPGRGEAHVEVDGLEIRVRMGWAFSAVIPRATVTGVREVDRRVGLARGAHGWRGNWLVNGAGDGLVQLDMEPRIRARVTGVSVRVRRLTVSVDDPAGLVDAIEAIRLDVD